MAFMECGCGVLTVRHVTCNCGCNDIVCFTCFDHHMEQAQQEALDKNARRAPKPKE